MVSPLNREPDIWNVAGTESTTTNKAVEVMEFEVELFLNWKTVLWKGCTNIAAMENVQRHRLERSATPIQRKAMPKN